jgi:hypothetical protein
VSDLTTIAAASPSRSAAAASEAEVIRAILKYVASSPTAASPRSPFRSMMKG